MYCPSQTSDMRNVFFDLHISVQIIDLLLHVSTIETHLLELGSNQILQWKVKLRVQQ